MHVESTCGISGMNRALLFSAFFISIWKLILTPKRIVTGASNIAPIRLCFLFEIVFVVEILFKCVFKGIVQHIINAVFDRQ